MDERRREQEAEIGRLRVASCRSIRLAAKQLIDGPNQYPPSKGLLALRQAVAAFGTKPTSHFHLGIPCTPESVLWAVEAARKA